MKGKTMSDNKKARRQKTAVRIVSLALAIIMALSVAVYIFIMIGGN